MLREGGWRPDARGGGWGKVPRTGKMPRGLLGV